MEQLINLEQEKRLSGKRILITGASSGIGEALARKVAMEGAEVILVARREDNLERILSDITSNGGKGSIFPADLANPEEVSNAFSFATNNGNKQLDVVINNAGILNVGMFGDQDMGEIRQMQMVNIEAMTYVSKTALDTFKKQGQGHLVYNCSTSSIIPIPEYGVYSATKAYGRSLHFGAAKYASDKGIDISVVSFGVIDNTLYSGKDNSGNRVEARTFPFLLDQESAVKAIIERAILNKERDIVEPLALRVLTLPDRLLESLTAIISRALTSGVKFNL